MKQCHCQHSNYYKSLFTAATISEQINEQTNVWMLKVKKTFAQFQRSVFHLKHHLSI